MSTISGSGFSCTIGRTCLPSCCCTVFSSSAEESPCLGFLERRGKTTNLLLYALSLFAFSCINIVLALPPALDEQTKHVLCCPVHCYWLLANDYLKALKRPVLPTVVDCNTNSASSLRGNCCLLHTRACLVRQRVVPDSGYDSDMLLNNHAEC